TKNLRVSAIEVGKPISRENDGIVFRDRLGARRAGPLLLHAATPSDGTVSLRLCGIQRPPPRRGCAACQGRVPRPGPSVPLTAGGGPTNLAVRASDDRPSSTVQPFCLPVSQRGASATGASSAGAHRGRLPPHVSPHPQRHAVQGFASPGFAPSHAPLLRGVALLLGASRSCRDAL